MGRRKRSYQFCKIYLLFISNSNHLWTSASNNRAWERCDYCFSHPTFSILKRQAVDSYKFIIVELHHSLWNKSTINLILAVFSKYDNVDSNKQIVCIFMTRSYSTMIDLKGTPESNLFSIQGFALKHPTQASA